MTQSKRDSSVSPTTYFSDVRSKRTKRLRRKLGVTATTYRKIHLTPQSLPSQTTRFESKLRRRLKPNTNISMTSSIKKREAVSLESNSRGYDRTR
jgi:hypothetical protein